jgi:RNA polymerase sigma factor (sigma-70 family)
MRAKDFNLLSKNTLGKIHSSNLTKLQKQVLEDLFQRPVCCMPDDRFKRPSDMAKVMEQEVSVVTGTSLNSEEEITLFLQMNFCRYKMSVIQRHLKRSATWKKSELTELLEWNERQLRCRSKIVTANMGLVLAMAKRMDSRNVEFTDLISEGSMALLRASEKFNCALGWKFSTYACRAILKAFSRASKQAYRYRSRFPAQLDTSLIKDEMIDHRYQSELDSLVDDVRDIMKYNRADLTGVERSIVELRFSLKDRERKPLTLKQVGEVMGLTKERIRQIQKKALNKLKLIAEDSLATT